MDQPRFGIRWKSSMRMTDLDFADDIALVAEDHVCVSRDDHKSSTTQCKVQSLNQPTKNKSSSGDEIPKRDVTYLLPVYH